MTQNGTQFNYTVPTPQCANCGQFGETLGVEPTHIILYLALGFIVSLSIGVVMKGWYDYVERNETHDLAFYDENLGKDIVVPLDELNLIQRKKNRHHNLNLLLNNKQLTKIIIKWAIL